MEHHAGRHGEAVVTVDLLARDPEGRDDPPDDPVGAIQLLEHLDLDAVAAQEDCTGDARRSGTDDGDAHPRDERCRCGCRDDVLLRAVGGSELHSADVDARVVVEPRAVLPARLGAEHPGDRRGRVVADDHPEGVGLAPRCREGEVLRHLLLDRAATVLAGGGEAVGQQEWRGRLPRPHLIAVALVGPLVRRDPGSQRLEGVDVDAVVVGHDLGRELRQLSHPGVAAGLEERRRDGHRLDAGPQDRRDVRGVRAAGIRDRQATVERAGDLRGEGERERQQGPPGQVHLGCRQLTSRDVVREGVAQLQAEDEADGIRLLAEPVEHRHGVLVLQVLGEVVVVEGEVRVAEVVERGAREVVPEHGGVALDDGVQALVEEVVRDPLDLVGRTAVHRRDRHRVADPRRDALEVAVVEAGEAAEVALQPGHRLPVRGRGGRVAQSLDEPVDPRVADAGEVVPDGGVERDVVPVGETELDREHPDGEVGVDVLGERLLDGELRGPLAVEAFVLGVDAGLRHGGPHGVAVDDLDGLELDEARPGEVGDDDVGGQLGVRTRGRSHGGGQAVAERVTDRATGRPEEVLGRQPEDGPVPSVLGERPRDQPVEGEGSHDVAHHGIPAAQRVRCLIPRW